MNEEAQAALYNRLETSQSKRGSGLGFSNDSGSRPPNAPIGGQQASYNAAPPPANVSYNAVPPPEPKSDFDLAKQSALEVAKRFAAQTSAGAAPPAPPAPGPAASADPQGAVSGIELAKVKAAEIAARLTGSTQPESIQDDDNPLKRQRLDTPEKEEEEVLLSEKILAPTSEHPNEDFVALVMGPKGAYVRQMETETGAKFIIQGVGAPVGNDTEGPLRVMVQANRPEKVLAAAKMIKDLFGNEEYRNRIKREQHRMAIEQEQEPAGLPPMFADPEFANRPDTHRPISGPGTVKRISVPASRVGLVIGRGGENIKYLQMTSGARIQVNKDPTLDAPDMRSIELSGTPAQIERAERMIEDIGLHDRQQPQSSGHSMPQGDKLEMMIPNSRTGAVIGKGGETIRSLQQRSGAYINIQGDRDVQPGSSDRLCTITGPKESCEAAKRLIEEIMNAPYQAPARHGYSQQQYGYPGYNYNYPYQYNYGYGAQPYGYAQPYPYSQYYQYPPYQAPGGYAAQGYAAPAQASPGAQPGVPHQPGAELATGQTANASVAPGDLQSTVPAQVPPQSGQDSSVIPPKDAPPVPETAESSYQGTAPSAPSDTVNPPAGEADGAVAAAPAAALTPGKEGAPAQPAQQPQGWDYSAYAQYYQQYYGSQ